MVFPKNEFESFKILKNLTGPLHNAERSGTARATESACVTNVAASLHGSSFLRSWSLSVSLISTLEVRVRPPSGRVGHRLGADDTQRVHRSSAYEAWLR